LQSSDLTGLRVSTSIDVVSEDKGIDLQKLLKEEDNNTPL